MGGVSLCRQTTYHLKGYQNRLTFLRNRLDGLIRFQTTSGPPNLPFKEMARLDVAPLSLDGWVGGFRNGRLRWVFTLQRTRNAVCVHVCVCEREREYTLTAVAAAVGASSGASGVVGVVCRWVEERGSSTLSTCGGRVGTAVAPDGVHSVAQLALGAQPREPDGGERVAHAQPRLHALRV